MSETMLPRRELMRRAGDLSQLLGARQCRLEGGRAEGLRVVDAWNGSGLEFSALADRGLDIYRLTCRGRNFSYLGSPGLVAPAYCDDSGVAWLRSFGAGFLVTCGLRNVGGSCEEGGESFGLHGRASAAPAEALSADVAWEGERASVVVSGRMREARVFGENLRLERRIVAPCGEDRLVIEDRVVNLGFREEQIAILYHFNLGYPLLDEGARVLAPSSSVRPRVESMRPGLARWQSAQPPTRDWAEEVFFHELRPDSEGMTEVALVNERSALGLSLRFDARSMPRFTQWKMMGEGEYVMGLEPGNCLPEGRKTLCERGELETLAPGESRSFRVEAAFATDSGGIERIAREIAGI
jgi:hypothetical protein